MIPKKISDLIAELRKRTESGQITWHYDDNQSTVVLQNAKFSLAITYRFDEVEEVGRFNLKYTDQANGKDYFFSTTQQYDDYDLVRLLFDSAQSSELNVDMDF